MMKRIVAWLFFLSIFIVLAALVAPSLIDWSKHKEALLSQIRPYLQRDITVAGNVSFQLIPNPQIMMGDVTIANVDGAKNPVFMKLKQLEARIKFGPLLQGQFEVETINLANPELNLEILPDGDANWTEILQAKDGKAAGTLSDHADSVQLNQVTMTDGTLHYLNQATGSEWQVQHVNVTVGADTLFGPYRVKGDMEYNKSSVGLEMTTGQYGNGQPVPVNIQLSPVEGLPMVKFDGTADLSSGLDMQGILDVNQGTLASLFDSQFLKGIGFMNEIATLNGTAELKGGTAKLSDIKATFGKKGELNGNIAAQFTQGKKPDIVADISGGNLKIDSGSSFIDVPEGFTAHLKLKGKNIGWGGVNLPAVTLAADTDKEEWVVKDGRIDLPGKSKIKLAGVVTPKNNYAAFSMQASTDELPKMLASLGLNDGNIVKSAGESGIIQKLEWSSSLDIKLDQVSMFDVSARADDRTDISGVLNILRDSKTPGYFAHLNFSGLDFANIDAAARKSFADRLVKANGILEVSGKDIHNGSLAISDFTLKGKTDGTALLIDSLTGTFAPAGSFTLGGRVTGVSPIAGADLTYSIKGGQFAGLSNGLGLDMPPPLWGDQPLDVTGTLKGDNGQYAFTATGTTQEGNGFTVNGTASRGADGKLAYKNDVTLKQARWNLFGLPADHLFADGVFDFNGKIAGTSAAYTVTDMKAGAANGTFSRADGKYTGAIAADAVNLDAWFNDWKVVDSTDLHLTAKKMIWRTNEVANAELHVVASPGHTDIAVTKGSIWGGNLVAQGGGDRQANGGWNGKLAGKASGIELQQLMDNLDFKGFKSGRGDFTFDVTSDSAKDAKDWFHGSTGEISMTSDALTIDGFNTASLPKMVADVTGAPETDFLSRFGATLKSGRTVYNDVNGSFKMADGKISIEKLRLADGAATVNVDGSYDLGPKKYNLLATVQMKGPPGVPSFTVSRAGDIGNAPDYTVNAKAIENYLTQKAPKDPPVAVTPQTPKPDGKDAIDAPPTIKPLSPIDNPHDEPGLPQSYTQTPATPDSGKGDDAGGETGNAPVEAEPLDAPAPTPPPPEKPAADIKGILDRLDDAPAATPPATPPAAPDNAGAPAKP
ncbi:MAG: AsmA family protein [Micavibrio sp.]|nr:AsmA family protein [Micavibrio sp.]